MSSKQRQGKGERGRLRAGARILLIIAGRGARAPSQGCKRGSAAKELVVSLRQSISARTGCWIL